MMNGHQEKINTKSQMNSMKWSRQAALGRSHLAHPNLLQCACATFYIQQFFESDFLRRFATFLHLIVWYADCDFKWYGIIDTPGYYSSQELSQRGNISYQSHENLPSETGESEIKILVYLKVVINISLLLIFLWIKCLQNHLKFRSLCVKWSWQVPMNSEGELFLFDRFPWYTRQNNYQINVKSFSECKEWSECNEDLGSS